MPGGDLVVEATRTGFEQFLRLNRASEGGAPMVLPMTVPDGVTARQNVDGSVTFTDAMGEERMLKEAQLVYNYSKRRKMKLSFRKMVGALLGIDGIKKHCRF
ncbi:hypothetical protein [Streptomyces sp. NBC_00829]|uniref:hypothetical protein n=1 Tax=Streptomyces sp. NBC_00829 TaxID=2903679 RepID=UPI00386DF776|nr:hypothetical protein OG293_01055 [Streptomyces sp. NBC_00829]